MLITGLALYCEQKNIDKDTKESIKELLQSCPRELFKIIPEAGHQSIYSIYQEIHPKDRFENHQGMTEKNNTIEDII